VDSENKKNLQNDVWRLFQLNKELSNPNHPYCSFSTGNLQTLKERPVARGIDVREEFMKFHEREYSANRMKLVVLGRESLSELESWVVELFAGVRNKDLKKNRWDDIDILTKDNLLHQSFAKPVMDVRSLSIDFVYMDEENLYETQPSRYISHLIGHEGPGSVLSYIKDKGWANSLSAGSSPVAPGQALYCIEVRLTEDGLKNYLEIVKVIFQYIYLLKKQPPQQWIFDELRGMADVNFKYKQKTPASKFTSNIARVMQKPIPREWLLSGTSLIRKFDPEAISKGLSYLRPDNFRLSVVSQTYPGGWDKKEKWYGTEYKVEKISADVLQSIESADVIPELHLPHKNEFIPSNLHVEKKEVKIPTKVPKLLRRDDTVRLWWKKDDTFWVPKGNVSITLRSPLVSATPLNATKTRMFTELVQDALVEYSYDADIAGLSYSLSCHSLGIDIGLSGYNDKMPVLLEKVLISMRDLEVKADRFEIVKERLLRGYRNWEFAQPYYQIGDFTRWLNLPDGWINSDYLSELPHVTAADVRSFFPSILEQLHMEVFVHGNFYKEDALKIVDLVESTLKPRPLRTNQWKVRRSLSYPRGTNYIYRHTLKDPANVNHAVESFFPVGDSSDRSLRAKLLLMAQILDEPIFDQLRTKEQLGYVVFSGGRWSATTMGFRVLIQSERTPDYLDSRVDDFLSQFRKTLEDMDLANFEKQKRSLINHRLESLKNLDEETNRLWDHIESEVFDFEKGMT
jgi:insulysin